MNRNIFICIFKVSVDLKYCYACFRALDLAIKYKLDLVNLLSKRQQYLTTFNKTESNEKYLQAISNIEIN